MPFSSDIYIPKDLNKVSVAYRNDAYVADYICPMIPVKQETGKYFVYGKENFLMPEIRQANGAKANELSYNVSNASYLLAKYAGKLFVSDDDKANADAAIRPDIDATEFLVDQLMLKKEFEAAKALMTGTSWTSYTSLSAANFASNTTTTNPIPYFHTASAAIIKQSALSPNLVVFSNDVFVPLQDHVSIVERVKYTSDVVTEKMLAALFNCGKLVVGKAIYNTAKEGATESMGQVWGDGALIAHVAPAPGLRKPSAAYCFHQQSFGTPYKISKWRDEDAEGDWVKCASKFQVKVISADCGYLIANAV